MEKTFVCCFCNCNDALLSRVSGKFFKSINLKMKKKGKKKKKTRDI